MPTWFRRHRQLPDLSVNTFQPARTTRTDLRTRPGRSTASIGDLKAVYTGGYLVRNSRPGRRLHELHPRRVRRLLPVHPAGHRTGDANGTPGGPASRRSRPSRHETQHAPESRIPAEHAGRLAAARAIGGSILGRLHRCRTSPTGTTGRPARASSRSSQPAASECHDNNPNPRPTDRASTTTFTRGYKQKAAFCLRRLRHHSEDVDPDRRHPLLQDGHLSKKVRQAAASVAGRADCIRSLHAALIRGLRQRPQSRHPGGTDRQRRLFGRRSA